MPQNYASVFIREEDQSVSFFLRIYLINGSLQRIWNPKF